MDFMVEAAQINEEWAKLAKKNVHYYVEHFKEAVNKFVKDKGLE